MQKASFNRRAVLGMTASAMAAPTLPLSALPVSASDTPLYKIVAEKARALGGEGARLSILVPHGSEANIRPVIDRFTTLSGVRVVSRDVPVDEINTQLTLDGLSGEADYDLALPATFGIPDLADGGVIRPLTDFAATHEPPGFRDDVLYSIGDTFDGEIYGFQVDGDTYVMFYNDLWMSDPSEQAAYEDRFGQPLSIPQSWEELDRQMAFFHRPDEGRFGGALFRTPSYLAWEWWVRFHAKGVWPLSKDLEPQVASDEGVAALEEMIRATEFLYPQARAAGLFENWEEYAKGKVYANIGWGGSQKYFNGPNSQIAGKMRFGLTPCSDPTSGMAGMPYFNWGWNYVVTAASRQPELAYLFALFASTSEISTLSMQQRDGYFDPVRPEHYDDPVIQATYSPEFLAVHRQSMQGSIPDLYLAQQGEYFRVLIEALDSAVNRGTPPKDALKKVETQWSVLNLRAGRQAQTDRWRALRTKYPAEIQAMLRDLD